MENTEVMEMVENEVIEPVVEEIAKAEPEKAFNTTVLKGFALGTLACVVGFTLYKYVGKPLAKKVSSNHAARKRERALKLAGIDRDSEVTAGCDEEVDDSE